MPLGPACVQFLSCRSDCEEEDDGMLLLSNVFVALSPPTTLTLGLLRPRQHLSPSLSFHPQRLEHCAAFCVCLCGLFTVAGLCTYVCFSSSRSVPASCSSSQAAHKSAAHQASSCHVPTSKCSAWLLCCCVVACCTVVCVGWVKSHGAECFLL